MTNLEVLGKLLPYMQAIIEANLSEERLLGLAAALAASLAEEGAFTLDEFKQKLMETAKV